MRVPNVPRPLRLSLEFIVINRSAVSNGNFFKSSAYGDWHHDWLCINYVFNDLPTWPSTCYVTQVVIMEEFNLLDQVRYLCFTIAYQTALRWRNNIWELR